MWGATESGFKNPQLHSMENCHADKDVQRTTHAVNDRPGLRLFEHDDRFTIDCGSIGVSWPHGARARFRALTQAEIILVPHGMR
jgi:hypothetical protein